MHQQEVAGIGLLSHLLADAGRHGNGGHTGRADEGIDLFLQEQVHELGQQHAACGAEAEGHNAHAHDHQRLGIEEGGAGGGGAYADAKEDGDNVHQLVLHGLAEPVGNAALLGQITEHQTGDQRRGGGYQQRHKDGDHDGEDDLLFLADHAQGFHDDLAFLLGGQRLHDRRLDHRHQRHVGIGRHGDGAQQRRSQHGGDEDGGGAVGTADDAHGTGLSAGEAQIAAAYIGHKDAQLRGSAQQQALGVGDQGAEIGHGAHTHEDETGVNAQLDAQIQHINKTHGNALSHGHAAEHRFRYAQSLHFGNKLRRNGVSAEQIPVDVSAGEEDLVEHLRAGQVGHQHADGDRHQQQRFKLLDDTQKQQDDGHKEHHRAFPVVALKKLVKTGLCAKIQNGLHDVPSITGWCTAARRTLRRRPWSRPRRSLCRRREP